MIDDMEAEHRLRWMLFDAGILVICMLGMFASQLLTPIIGLTVFTISFFAFAGIMGLTIVEIVQLTRSVDKYMKAQITLPKVSAKLVEEAKRFKDDKRGVLWIWAVCFLTIIVMSIAWFSLSWPAFMILDQILASYNFNSTARLAITLVSNVISWFLILMVLGLLFWAFVNSGRREDQTYGL